MIFICPFDVFGKGRHLYTFENICKEDHTLSLGDGTTKIFLNATVIWMMSAKKNREWRHEYMTLLMRDQENIEKGKIYGAITAYKDLDLQEDVILKKLQINFHLTLEEAKKYWKDLN